MITVLLAQDSIIGTIDPSFYVPRVDAVYDDGETHTVSGAELLDKVTVVSNGSHVIGQSLASSSGHDATYDSMFEVEGAKLSLEESFAEVIVVNDGHVDLEDTRVFLHPDGLLRANPGYVDVFDGFTALSAFGDSVVRIDDGSKIENGDDDFGIDVLRAFDNSKVEVRGGLVGPSRYEGNSVVQLFGGQMHSVNLVGNSRLEMQGGEVSGGHKETSLGISFAGDTHAALHGGKVVVDNFTSTGFQGSGRGSLAVGDVETSVTSVFGGSAYLFNLSGESTAEVSAGTHRVSAPSNSAGSYLARLSDSASLRIRGGEFQAPDGSLLASVQGQASLVVTGSNFNYPLGTITDRQGELTGILADGHSFRWNFIRGENATILLVPEPSTALPLALAAAFTVSRTRRKRI